MPGETIQERLTENLFARRADRWITGAIAVLLVALGFIAGRWTSRESNATPIVFQEAPEGAPAEVTEEDLDALVAGAETEVSRAASARGREPSSAAKESEESSAEPSEASSLGAFVASVNGKKYYFPDCAGVKRIKEENLIWFDSEEEAAESGYEPSACNLKRQQ
ncbi:MAG: hypothetical protein G01um101438_141 [Parcubacteria group bacterium Gr01-1014_38]|nr:MAG: hypothetical protein G01um101438_141 [Parcubacteria group bacterium Gr01-1014_38]